MKRDTETIGMGPRRPQQVDCVLERRSVKTGASSVTLVEAAAGLSDGDPVALPTDIPLKPGDRLITEGLAKVMPDMPVKPVPANPPPETVGESSQPDGKPAQPASPVR